MANAFIYIIAFGVVALFVSTRAALPRGIRNNNPLNIRENQRTDYAWLGESVIDLDAGFEVFDSAEYGYRAAARIIASYARRGIVTLEDIISTWAPTNENDTQAYIASVVKNTGINRRAVITHDQLTDLFAAMTLHENGQQPYDRGLIALGVSLA